MSKSNPLKHIRADFLGHLKRFYKADSSPDGRRHVEFLQDVVRCLPVDLREAYWDLQLVALACTYLADGELRFKKETPFFGQFAEFELGDRSYEDVCRDVCERAFRLGPFLELLLEAEWFPFVFDSETDLAWGRNRQGEGRNRLGYALRSVLQMVLNTLDFCRWQSRAAETQDVVWARAGWWHKITKTSDWVGVLAENPVPEFVRHCPFDRFSVRDWIDLLRWQPKFFDICHLSQKRDPEFWADVACLMPERLDDAHWARISPAQWLNVLAFHPELSARAPWAVLEAEDGDKGFVHGWGMLLL